MTSKRLYLILCSVVSLLIISILGGAYEANVILQNKAKEVTEARSRSEALEQEQTQLGKAKASIEKYREVSTIAKSIVPQDKNQAQAVREIVKIANDQGISLSSVSFPASTLGGSGTASKPGLSQLKAATGISGVYILPITVQSSSSQPTSYSQFLNFLAALEHNRRTALVSALTLSPDQKNPNLVSFTLNIDEYIKP
jgi:hypothetical protein